MSIKTLRNLIHAGETAARSAREMTEARERDLATQACAALYATFDDASDIVALRKLVSCARRLSNMSATRWGTFSAALEKVFRFSVDSGAKVA
jgi:hypothetical protein